MAIPPQFLKNKKKPNDDETEAVDNAAEDAQELPAKGKGKPDAKKAAAKKFLLMQMAKKG